MSDKIVSETTTIIGNFISGHTVYEDGRKQDWVQLTQEAYDKFYWFLNPNVLSEYNIANTKQPQFLSMVEGDLEKLTNIIYILHRYKDQELPNKKPINEYIVDLILSFGFIDPKTLNPFIQSVKEGQIDTVYTKEIMEKLLNGKSLDDIILEYKTNDAIDIDTIIHKVISEQKQFKNQDQKINYFVGQTIKQLKGEKVSPLKIRSRVIELLQ